MMLVSARRSPGTGGHADLVEREVDILTLGQYLRPTDCICRSTGTSTPTSSPSWPARRGDGLRHVEAGPLVRSSYRADRQLMKSRAAKDASPTTRTPAESQSQNVEMARRRRREEEDRDRGGRDRGRGRVPGDGRTTARGLPRQASPRRTSSPAASPRGDRARRRALVPGQVSLSGEMEGCPDARKIELLERLIRTRQFDARMRRLFRQGDSRERSTRRSARRRVTSSSPPNEENRFCGPSHAISARRSARAFRSRPWPPSLQPGRLTGRRPLHRVPLLAPGVLGHAASTSIMMNWIAATARRSASRC